MTQKRLTCATVLVCFLLMMVSSLSAQKTDIEVDGQDLAHPTVDVEQVPNLKRAFGDQEESANEIRSRRL